MTTLPHKNTVLWAVVPCSSRRTWYFGGIYLFRLQGWRVSQRKNQSQRQSYITTDSQSASPSWCQAPTWDPRQIFPFLSLIIFIQLRVCWCGTPSLKKGWVCNLQSNEANSMSRYIATDGLSASSSWCRAPNGTHDQILITLFDNYFLSSRCRVPSPISPMNRVIQPEVKVKNQSYVSARRNS
jgi:hypothetical protein